MLRAFGRISSGTGGKHKPEEGREGKERTTPELVLAREEKEGLLGPDD